MEIISLLTKDLKLLFMGISQFVAGVNGSKCDREACMIWGLPGAAVTKLEI